MGRGGGRVGGGGRGGRGRVGGVGGLCNFAHTQVQSMDDNCEEWVECMGVASGCG